ncbi:energy transducer TonB, partial [Pricia sp.]|uniref:energy transducer TonB n=1 Tax=Pricia sp. TaxID=2268138 RepID=UPI0035938491
YSLLLKGIERTGLKQEISKAKSSFESFKAIQLIAMGAAVILATIVIYIVFFQNKPKAQNDFEGSPVESVTLKNSKEEESLVFFEDTISGTLKNNAKNPLHLMIADSGMAGRNEKFQILKDPQIFILNTIRDTILGCKEGTRIFVPKNSFVIKNSGVPVSGSINFKVSEYYKLSDLLLAKLSTTSNGEQLETGGMLFIEAFQNDQKLELKQGNTLDILFAGRKEDDGMKLFHGDWVQGKTNWILAEDKTENIQNLKKEEDIEVPFAVIEEIPRFPGCQGIAKEEAKKCTSDAIGKFISENFNFGIAASLRLEGNQRISVIFKINKNGEILYVNSRGPHPLLEEETNRVISSMPKFIPGKQRGRAVTVPYSLPFLFSIDGDKATVFSQNSTRNFNLDIRDIPMDTIVTIVRGEVEKIQEVMHDADFEVDSNYIKSWNEFEKQNLIRIFGKASEKQVMLRKSLFEVAESRFKQLASDSVTRGGHILRKVWDSTKIPTTSKIITLVPRKQVYLGTERMDIQDFENELLSDSTSNRIGSYDLSRYAFKTTSLGWLNCDRFL